MMHFAGGDESPRNETVRSLSGLFVEGCEAIEACESNVPARVGGGEAEGSSSMATSDAGRGVARRALGFAPLPHCRISFRTCFRQRTSTQGRCLGSLRDDFSKSSLRKESESFQQKKKLNFTILSQRRRCLGTH